MRKLADDIFCLRISRRWEILLFVVLFGLAIFLRFYDLSADPPDRISLSSGIETDPPGHTVFARSAVLNGDWNPYQDNRFITYQYSLISGAAWVVYKLLGVGVYQTNLVSVIISLLSLFLFYFVLRKSMGNGVALLALFFIGINYIGIFIGRRPFLENGMNFLFILALFCLTCWEKRLPGHFLFGFFTAAAILFGKVIALAFLGVPAVYYLYKIAVLKDREGYGQAAAYVAGLFFMIAGWYFLVFAPHASSVTGYMDEQIFGLHGSPEAFNSLSHFIWKFLVFGIQTAFFDRMPAISIASLAFIIILSSRLFTRDRAISRRFDNLILIAIVVWLAGTYIGEMPWNYHPLRYLTAMIYPLGALTAVLIAYLYKQKGQINPLNRSLIFNSILLVLLMLFSYQITRAVVAGRGGDFNFSDYIAVIAAIVLLIWFVYFLMAWNKRKAKIELPRYFRYSLIGLILIVSLYYQAGAYLAWARTPLYTTRQASRDLAQILSPEAVISGPYGCALTIENRISSIVHYFGTTRPDPTLFLRYPVTHLALDKANEEVARRIYPDLMKKATLLCSYNINCDKVSVYNIAYHTGNQQAMAYRLSLFEQATGFYGLNLPDSANYYMERFLRANPDNIGGNTVAGLTSLVNGEFEKAAGYFARGVDFSFTDFNLHFLLGNAYIGLAGLTGDQQTRERGEAEIDLARKYSFGKLDLDNYIVRSPKDRENGNTTKK